MDLVKLKKEFRGFFCRRNKLKPTNIPRITFECLVKDIVLSNSWMFIGKGDSSRTDQTPFILTDQTPFILRSLDTCSLGCTGLSQAWNISNTAFELLVRELR